MYFNKKGNFMKIMYGFLLLLSTTFFITYSMENPELTLDYILSDAFSTRYFTKYDIVNFCSDSFNNLNNQLEQIVKNTVLFVPFYQSSLPNHQESARHAINTLKTNYIGLTVQQFRTLVQQGARQLKEYKELIIDLKEHDLIARCQVRMPTLLAYLEQYKTLTAKLNDLTIVNKVINARSERQVLQLEKSIRTQACSLIARINSPNLSYYDFEYHSTIIKEELDTFSQLITSDSSIKSQSKL